MKSSRQQLNPPSQKLSLPKLNLVCPERRAPDFLIKGSLDAKLPSYELLKMLKVIDS